MSRKRRSEVEGRERRREKEEMRAVQSGVEGRERERKERRRSEGEPTAE